jgi:homocysteine S-methyltransferase
MAYNAVRFLDGGLSTQLEIHHEVDIVACGKLWTAALLLTEGGRNKLLAAHAAFYGPGKAGIILSSSYQASIQGFVEYGKLSESEAEALLRTSVTVAVAAREQARAAGRPDAEAWCSVGPYGAALGDGSEYTGQYPPGIGAAQLAEFHTGRLCSFSGCGADGFAIETIPSASEARVLADIMSSANYGGADCWVSFQCRPQGDCLADGTPLAQVAADVCERLKPRGARGSKSYIGLNCAAPSTVDALLPVLLRAVSEAAHMTGVVLYPNNGGTWDAEARAWVQPGGGGNEAFCAFGRQWASAVAASGKQLIIGGCCSTEHTLLADLHSSLVCSPCAE